MNSTTSPEQQAALAERRGLMFILSSPSGAGKTTLTKLLLAEDSALRLSVSATTRTARPGEIDGQDYIFIDRATFEAQRDAGAFLEWAEVFGNLYGTPKEPVETALAAGRDVLIDIDWQGTRQVVRAAPADVVRVFILPPSREAQKARLHKRATESPEALARRLAGAAEEITHWPEYDYVLVNDVIETTLEALRHILFTERHKRERRPGIARFVEGLLRENEPRT